MINRMAAAAAIDSTADSEVTSWSHRRSSGRPPAAPASRRTSGLSNGPHPAPSHMPAMSGSGSVGTSRGVGGLDTPGGDAATPVSRPMPSLGMGMGPNAAQSWKQTPGSAAASTAHNEWSLRPPSPQLGRPNQGYQDSGYHTPDSLFGRWAAAADQGQRARASRASAGAPPQGRARSARPTADSAVHSAASMRRTTGGTYGQLPPEMSWASSDYVEDPANVGPSINSSPNAQPAAHAQQQLNGPNLYAEPHRDTADAADAVHAAGFAFMMSPPVAYAYAPSPSPRSGRASQDATAAASVSHYASHSPGEAWGAPFAPVSDRRTPTRPGRPTVEDAAAELIHNVSTTLEVALGSPLLPGPTANGRSTSKAAVSGARSAASPNTSVTYRSKPSAPRPLTPSFASKYLDISSEESDEDGIAQTAESAPPAPNARQVPQVAQAAEDDGVEDDEEEGALGRGSTKLATAAVARAMSRVSQLASQNKELGEAVEQLELALGDTQERYVMQSAALTALVAERDALAAERDALEAQATALQQAQQEAEMRAQGLRAESVAAQVAVEAGDKEIQVLKHHLDELSAHAVAVEAAAAAAAHDADGAQQVDARRAASAEAQATAALSQVAELQAALKALQEKAAGSESRAATAEARLAAMLQAAEEAKQGGEGERVRLARQVWELTDALAEARATLKAERAGTSGNLDDLTAARNTVKELEQQLDAAKDAVQSQEKLAAALQESLTQQEREVHALRNELITLRVRVSALA